jgi:signal peptidase
MLRTYVVRVLAVVFLLLTIALVIGPLLGQPVLLSFVTSESMSPTIQEGDGFVVVPDALAGDVDEGDVIVFDAQEIQGGGLTTHRVVEETEDGYITRGDNNPFTDQDGDEPPVTDDQIVGVAWQPGGGVVVVPYVGTAVLGVRSVVSGAYNGVATALGFGGSTGTQAPIIAIAALLVLVAVADSLREDSSRDWTRSRDGDEEVDVRYVAVLLVAVVVLPANGAMLLPDTTQEVSMQDVAADRGAEPGEEIEVELSAANDGFVTMLFMLDPPPDVRLDDRQLEIPGGSSTATTMHATVPPPEEQRVVDVSQHRYIVLLPPSLLITLHEFHPVVALGAINAVLVFGVLSLVIGLAGVRSRYARET